MVDKSLTWGSKKIVIRWCMVCGSTEESLEGTPFVLVRHKEPQLFRGVKVVCTRPECLYTSLKSSAYDKYRKEKNK